MSIVEFLETLRDEITDQDISLKEKALRKISTYLSRLSFSDANTNSVNCLAVFYENILSEHYDLLPSIIDGISILIDFTNFSSSNAIQITKALVKLDVPQLKIPTRLKIFGLLHELFLSNLEELRNLDQEFIHNYLNAIDGENAPECVLFLMKLNLIIITNLNIDGVFEELFESVSAYFPVEFKSNNNITNETKNMIVTVTKQCLITSPLFGPQLLPLLIEKITADMKSAKRSSLDVLADCIRRLRFSDVFNYYLTLMDSLVFEYKNEDSEFHELCLRCVDEIATAFQNNADEKQLLEFCWYLVEINNSVVVNNNKQLLKFLLAGITGKCRVWCGVLAHMLPSLMEKLMRLDLDDIDKMEIIIDLLSANNNCTTYKGLMDSSQSNIFFTKLNEAYIKTLNSPVSDDTYIQISVMFRLLGHYSLFELWINSDNSDKNFVTDTCVIIESRCDILSRSMAYLANNKNRKLEYAMLELVPLLIQSSISLSNLENAFTQLVFSYVDKEDSLQNCVFEIFQSLPVSCLEIVLSVIESKLNQQLSKITLATFCLAKLVSRFSDDVLISEKLCTFILNIIENLISKQSILETNAVSNFALTLSELGTPSDESLKSSIIDVLLNESRKKELSQPCAIWLCTILGQSSIQIIEQSIKIRDLLNLIFLMILVTEEAELKSILYQTYASLLNKTDEFSTIEKDFIDHLNNLKDDATFILWNLKALMMSSNLPACNLLVDIITDSERMSTNFSVGLIQNIQILNRQNSDEKKHFCSEIKLFPKQNFLFEQQSYHLIAQRFQSLATDDNNNDITKDTSMEVYLKLISSYPKQIVDMYNDEISSTVSKWLTKLATLSGKTTLRIEALKAICNMHSSDNHLANYLDEIAENIVAVNNSLTTLGTRDRYMLAKIIGWFIITFPNYNANKYLPSLKTTLNKLINDHKRIVRMEAVKAKLFLLF